MARLTIVFRKKPDGERRVVRGRDAWALAELVAAGPKGCTPIDHPGPRWSGYVHHLRHDHALDIETRNETHGGRFPGHHGRYILNDAIEVLERIEASEGMAA